jgi:hypothetical protein
VARKLVSEKMKKAVSELLAHFMKMPPKRANTRNRDPFLPLDPSYAIFDL